jgi:hypothetical protein
MGRKVIILTTEFRSSETYPYCWLSVSWIRNDFFRIRIRILLFSWFGIRIRILHEFFYYFQHKFFLLHSPLLQSVLGCILWRDINFSGIFYNKKFIFFNWAFLFRNCQILSVFQKSLTSNSFWIRILLKVSDPTGSLSGSTTLPLMRFGSHRMTGG